MSGEALPREPESDDERIAVDGTRMSIWFEKQKDFYSGTVSYDTEFSAELATEGKAADNDADAPPLHYLLKYDDGDHPDWHPQPRQRGLH